ncbi:hypothetical protein [Marinifilum flexuosum]|uniref:hypothetical protein n=1 Tax=Marinifilum flexuosum TaxID=1117708 RepID=UPI00249413E5|nr:hypothetical protein [Marinifilum flexuosum]
MKVNRAYKFVVLIFLFGCKITSDQDLKWNKVKDKQDFASFFGFALNNSNPDLQKACIDSLEKYKPNKEWIVLNKYEYYHQAKDSLIETSFYEYDESDIRYETKRRNIVHVNIDGKDSVKVSYIDDFHNDCTQLIKNLYDTTGESIEITEVESIEWNDLHYLSRKLAVHIHCEIFPDSLVEKTSWKALIKETKKVLDAFQSIRNSRAKHIFQKEFSELKQDEKNLIIGIVPLYFKIHFSGPFLSIAPPPPPPPPSMHEKYWPVSLSENDMLELDKELKQVDTTAKNGISIKFEEFTLLIDDIEVWEEGGELNQTHGDTVKVYPEIGEILGGNSMRIITTKYSNIEIFQRFENSITIMNEGPHCDMLEWKHYTSDWKKVEKYEEFSYTSNSISEEQMEKFIPVDLDEFKEAVKEHCGEGWAELVKDVTSVTEYPCGVGTSKIELRIRLSNPVDDKIIEKIIQFDIAMGC